MKKIDNPKTFTDHLNNEMVDQYLNEKSNPAPSPSNKPEETRAFLKQENGKLLWDGDNYLPENETTVSKEGFTGGEWKVEDWDEDGLTIVSNWNNGKPSPTVICTINEMMSNSQFPSVKSDYDYTPLSYAYCMGLIKVSCKDAVP